MPSSSEVRLPATIQAPPPSIRPLDRRSHRRCKNRRFRDGKCSAHSGGDPSFDTRRSAQTGSASLHARTPAIVAYTFDDRYRLVDDHQAVIYQISFDANRRQYENELTVLRQDVRVLIREDIRRSIQNSSLIMHEPKVDMNHIPQVVSAPPEALITHTAGDGYRKVRATMLGTNSPIRLSSSRPGLQGLLIPFCSPLLLDLIPQGRMKN